MTPNQIYHEFRDFYKQAAELGDSYALCDSAQVDCAFAGLAFDAHDFAQRVGVPSEVTERFISQLDTLAHDAKHQAGVSQ